MPSKRDRRRAILADTPATPAAPDQIRLIHFGSPRRAADRCTYYDAPAEFGLCLDCGYNKGAQGSGLRCGHRFGLDPTLVGGVPTQYTGGEIVPLDGDDR